MGTSQELRDLLNGQKFGASALAHMHTGPSSSTAPYYLPMSPQVALTAIITTGDEVASTDAQNLGSYTFGGIPDGLGAYDNPGSTFTLLVNHELRPELGDERAHGGTGAYISKLIIDEKTLQVVGGEDLIKEVYLWQGGDFIKNADVDFNRFCSADLAKTSAFFNAATGKGYDGLIYLNGEETTDGRAFAHFVDGAEAGKSYEMPFMGNLAFENVVANSYSGDKTLVIGTDDSTPGQVYLYVGDKAATGDALTRAGLVGGDLYGIKVLDAPADEQRATGFGAEEKAFTLVKLGAGAGGTPAVNPNDANGDVSAMNAAQLQTQSESFGVTEFLRPEDGAWDTVDPSRFYFVTTDRFDTEAQEGRSRLWRLDFNDVAHPEQGGKIELMVDNGPHQMFDNITVNSRGQVLIEEDPGNQAYSAKIWLYDPSSDKLSLLAQSNPILFGSDVLGMSPSAPFTQDEEASGIIDVSSILGSPGKDVYLFDVQAHYSTDPTTVEGGQLLAMELNANSLSSWNWLV